MKEKIEIIEVVLNKKEIDLIAKIVEKTENTWQSLRTLEQKFEDTVVGKLAEKALKNFIELENKNIVLPNLGLLTTEEYNNLNLNQYSIAFYDDFRQDDFSQHNDIDLIISPNNPLLLLTMQRIIEESKLNSKKFFSLSNNLKKSLKDNNVLIGEVKATRITERHLVDNEINFEKIFKDDFLEYPLFLRKTNNINFNEIDYFSYVKENFYKSDQSFDMNKLIELEKAHLKDFYIRIYVDKIQKVNDNEIKTTCFIVSAITNKNFIKNNLNLKKMPQKNKSENALYLFTPLSQGTRLKNFLKYKIPTIEQANDFKSFINSKKRSLKP